LSNDIVLNDTDMFAHDENGIITGAADGKTPKAWSGIGSYDKSFKGTFDGKGYEIKGIYINNGSSNMGLFRYTINAVIKNLSVTDGYIMGDDYVGAVVGNNSVSRGDALIANCYSTVTVCGDEYVGGIAGINDGNYIGKASIVNCQNRGRITAGGYGGGVSGGIAGFNRAYSLSTASIRNCRNYGSVSGNSDNCDYLGGITGNNYSDGGEAYIKESTNAGDVSGDEYIGGIAGNNNSIITGCENTGTVTAATFYGGGIAGINNSSKAAVTVTGCKNSGAVTAKWHSGGIVGNNNVQGKDIYVADCQNSGAITADSYGGGIAGTNGGNEGLGIISACKNTGVINAGTAGGIVGTNSASQTCTVTVTDCYNTGSVTNESYYGGGIAGSNVQYADTASAKVKNSYSLGAVTAKAYAGGVVGANNSGEIANCYYMLSSASDTNGVEQNGIGAASDKTAEDVSGQTTKLTDAQMRLKNSYVEFDFDNVWIMTDKTGNPYPELRTILLSEDAVAAVTLKYSMTEYNAAQSSDEWVYHEYMTTKYATLQEAFDAAANKSFKSEIPGAPEGDDDFDYEIPYIKLLKDVTIKDGEECTLAISSDLDLNGKTLTVSENGAFNGEGVYLDSSESQKKGTFTSSGNIGIEIRPWSDCTVNITGGNITKQLSVHGGKVNISGGVFSKGVSVNNSSVADTEITVSGSAEIKSFNTTVFLDSDYYGLNVDICDEARISDVGFDINGIDEAVARHIAVNIYGGYFRTNPASVAESYPENVRVAYSPEQYAYQADWAADAAKYMWRVVETISENLKVEGVLDGSTLTYTLTDAPSRSTLIAVRYDGETLTDIQAVHNPKGTSTLTMNGSGDKFRLFLWKDITTLKPYCSSWDNE
ncbi:MAG: hypothetical protein IJR33_01590, partial [Clostridia bacterium]|nr:hypothetical protein [Clostridia bacterium]